MGQQFASDNNAGMCPEALEALIRENAADLDGFIDDRLPILPGQEEFNAVDE